MLRIGAFSPRAWGVLWIGVLVPACVDAPVRPFVEADIAAALGLGAPLVAAREPAPDDVPRDAAGVLPLAEAVDRAAKNDPRIQSALARVRAELADAEQARLLQNPLLDVAFRVPSVADAEPEVDVGLTQGLVALLTRPGRSRAADERLRAAAADAVSVALDVVAETRERYVRVQSLDRQARLLAERRELMERLAELADARLAAGESARVDVTTIRTRAAELQIEAAELEVARLDARLELAKLVAEPSGAADWDLEPFAAPPPLEPGDRIARALEQRPELLRIEHTLAALREEAELARFTAWDGLGAGASAESAGGAWSVGPALAVPLPLFDTGAARRRAVEAAIEEAGHERTETRRRVIAEVRRALAAVEAADALALQVNDSLLPLQRRRREETQQTYLAGQVDVIAVILAEQDLFAAESKRIEVFERAAAARVRLERAVSGARTSRRNDESEGDGR